MPPELAWTGVRPHCVNLRPLQLQQRPLRRLELCAAEAGHLLVGSGTDLVFVDTGLRGACGGWPAAWAARSSVKARPR